MESWYLLYCKRGQLLRAKEHLERQEVHCLSPMIALEKIVRGKRTTVSEPLFPNYLFIEFDPEAIHTTTISSTRGVSHFVRFGTTPATVPSAVIEALETDVPQILLDPETPQSVMKWSSPTGRLKGCALSLPSRMVKRAQFCCLIC